jgi:hypothetical protein
MLLRITEFLVSAGKRAMGLMSSLHGMTLWEACATMVQLQRHAQLAIRRFDVFVHVSLALILLQFLGQRICIRTAWVCITKLKPAQQVCLVGDQFTRT